MANDDKNKDKDQDDFFGDDEDFGLPELDYEALDDDDSDDVQEEPKAEEAPAEEPKEEEEESVSAEDDSVFESESMDDMDDLDDMDMDDLGDMDDEDIPDQVSDEELEASLAGDDDFAADSTEDKAEDTDISDEAMEEFYEEESFDDFEASGDEGEDIPDSVFDSDVLDEDEFAQFEKELMETEEGDMADMSSFDSDDTSTATESKGKFAKVVIFGIIIFAGLGAAFMFMTDQFGGEGESNKPVAEKTQKPVAKKPEEKKPEESTNTPVENDKSEATKPEEAKPKAQTQRQAASTSKPKQQSRQVASNPGTVNSLTARTGNAFIIIASFVDGDMAMDYANKLAGQGKSPSIIPPFGNAITHRVAISGYPTIAAAQNALGSFQGDYGQDIWILKY